MKILSFIILFVPFFLLKSLETDLEKKRIISLISESKKNYESMDTYVLNLKFTLYNSPTSNDFSERYTGVSVKKDNNLYTKIDNTEFVQSQKFFIKIDNEQKLVKVENAPQKIQSPIDQLDELLLHFNKFDLKEDKNTIICTLTAPEITFTPYGKIVIYINKKERKIFKQVFYLLQRKEYINSKGQNIVSNPRLEIETTEGNSEIKLYYSKLSIENYVISKGEKHILTKNYRNYRIVE